MTGDKCALPHDNEALRDGRATRVVHAEAAGGLLGAGMVYPKGLHSVRDAPLPRLAHLLILVVCICCHLVCRLATVGFDSLHNTVIALPGAWAGLEPSPAVSSDKSVGCFDCQSNDDVKALQLGEVSAGCLLV